MLQGFKELVKQQSPKEHDIYFLLPTQKVCGDKHSGELSFEEANIDFILRNSHFGVRG